MAVQRRDEPEVRVMLPHAHGLAVLQLRDVQVARLRAQDQLLHALSGQAGRQR